MRICFVDTWAWVAMTNRRDAGHEVAVEVDRWLAEHRWVLATSDWVLDETLTQLQALGGSRVSLSFLEDIETQVQARTLMMVHSSQ
jgi:predicted nucleic acid-binding protein